MPDLIHGDVSDAFGPIADGFRRDFTERNELGAALTVVREGKALHFRQIPWPVMRRMMNPTSMTFKAFTNPKAITKLPDMNTRRLLELELPSVNGTGTARALTTIYGDDDSAVDVTTDGGGASGSSPTCTELGKGHDS